MASYHESASTSDTPQPLRPYEFIGTPAITLILDAIAERCGVGGCVSPSVRTIAEWAGVSPGNVSPSLRQLAEDGWITYDGRVIMLLIHPDQPADRDQASDQQNDHQPDQTDHAADRPTDQMRDRDQTPDRPKAISPLIGAIRRNATRNGTTDQPPDRFEPHMEDSYSVVVVQESESTTTENQVPCAAPNDQRPDRFAPAALVLSEIGADSVTLDLIRTAQPNLTPGDILPQWQIAQDEERDGYTSSARRLLFGTLKKPKGRLYGRATNAQLDPAAYAGRDGFKLGGDVSDQADESLHDRAARLVPASPTDRYAGQDFVWMQGQLLMQDWTDAQALEALAARRRRRGAP